MELYIPMRALSKKDYYKRRCKCKGCKHYHWKECNVRIDRYRQYLGMKRYGAD